MALDPNSYLPKFFTEERLRYYRELHERYPLWCGDWPEEESKLREARLWGQNRRIGHETKELEEEPIVVFFDLPVSENLIARPVFQWWEYVEDDQGKYHSVDRFTYETDPAAGAALLAAINYAFSVGRRTLAPGPRSGSPALHAIEEWIENLRATLVMERGNLPTKLGRDLVSARSRVLSTRPNKKEGGRDETIGNLEKLWRKVGQETGVIPWTKGGPLTILSNEFQGRLVKEAQGLVSEVKKWITAPEDVAWIRSTLPVTELPLAPQIQSLIEEKRRRGDRKGAEELKRKYTAPFQEALDRTQDVTEWLLQIDFPMLTEEEIHTIREDRRPRSTLGLACELLGSRLGMTGTTIQNNTAPYR